MTNTPEADRELLAIRAAQHGDSAALERLLSGNRPLLTAVANRLCATTALRDELVQAGYIGLMQAVQRFEPSQRTRLLTYAMPWILGEMKKALRCALDATGARQKQRELLRCEAALRASLGREPRLDELARACGMEAQQVAQVDACARMPLSMEAHMSSKGDGALSQVLSGGEEVDIDRLCLHMAIDELGEEERRLVYLRYFRDRTQKETALLLCKSQAQVSKMERRALDRLRALLA